MEAFWGPARTTLRWPDLLAMLNFLLESTCAIEVSAVN